MDADLVTSADVGVYTITRTMYLISDTYSLAICELDESSSDLTDLFTDGVSTDFYLDAPCMLDESDYDDCVACNGCSFPVKQ